jgi:uncharacterized protein (DUF58 family)
MLPKEIIEKIRKIEIRTKDLVNEVFSGEYQSVFKGRGMEFAEVRNYQHGDDIKTIDWNVTARMGTPYVKKFVEERELTVMLLIDASSSGEFGTIKQMKGEIAVEICALLAFSAIKNNDRVGLVIFTDQIEKFVPPKKGRTHVLRIIRELLYFKPERRSTDINAALQYLMRILKRRCVAFLVSDFLAENFEKTLRVANTRHDIIAIALTDPREIELPKIGFIELEDAETGEEILLDTSDPDVRERFFHLSSQKVKERNRFLNTIGVDLIDITTARSYVEPLISFFRMRAKRFR